MEPLDLNNLLEQAEKQAAGAINDAVNTCVDCKIPLLIDPLECKCPQCGRCYRYQTTDGTDPLAGTIRVSMKGGRSKRVGVNSNYTETQSKSIKNLLAEHKRNNDGKPGGIVIPMDVLTEVAIKYNEMQKINTDGKKFVKRANIKNQILCALIKIICDQKGLSRKEQDIARFMGLESDGFSQGDIIVRECVASGSLELNLEEDPLRDAKAFAERYLESLGMPAEFIALKSEFVKECIDESIKARIAFKSKITSKVAGIIWILNVNLKLGKTIKQLEDAVDGTKKSTYAGFVESIFKNSEKFEPIFKKYAVPYSAV